MDTTFHSYFPHHPLLKKHIHYFYFDGSADNNFYRKYSFFPHVKTTLSFYRNACIAETPEATRISYDPGAPLLKLLTRQHQVRTVVQQGPLEKIGIVFHPLGLNHFIEAPYYTIAAQEVQTFHEAGWDDAIRQCFVLKDREARITLLEDLLLSMHRHREYQQLYDAIQQLTSITSKGIIREIAAAQGHSVRHLQRDFQKHLAMSPELFRMITRFRHAVDQKIRQAPGEKLTGIAYEAGYPDQAYMIRVFKKLTGQTPSQFFKTGKHLGQADTFWKIVEPGAVA
jgi:AraC-like DNA-binding protein